MTAENNGKTKKKKPGKAKTYSQKNKKQLGEALRQNIMRRKKP